MLNKSGHPGRRLRRECFEQMGLTVTEVAKQVGVTRQALNNILNGKAGISPQMAVRLAVFFGRQPETLQQWQKEYELSRVRSDSTRRGKSRGYSFLLSSNDLVAWAETIDARYALPLLVRALVRVTAPSAREVDFPAMEDTQRPGWDGVIKNARRSSYVPAGTSVWELSTEARPQPKMERDYQKRTERPLGYEPAKATLVLVTLRRMASKKQWAAAKEQEGRWAGVVLYDAADLEQWLELAPEVAIWLAVRMGRRPAGVYSLENFWSEFSASTAPPMAPTLLLAGRGGAADKVAEWLGAGSGALSVLADSCDEALAFAAAVAASRADKSIRSALNDTIVVDDPEQARQLMGSARGLTFAWQIEEPSLLGAVIDKGHRVLVPLGRSTAGAEHADVELPRLNPAEFVAVIKDGLEGDDDNRRREQAEARARECGRSITVYRRRYAAAGVASVPAWASLKEAGELIPVLLAGGWSEASEADKSALSALANCDYLGVSRLLARCRNQPDSPIRRIGDTWTLVAPLDAWSLLAKYITDVDLKRYRETVLQVLGEADPALDVEPGERWLASLYDKERKHSNALRSGLADSLILLSVVGDKAGAQTSTPLGSFCEALVAELIGHRPTGTKWCSIFEQLPALAEAAPESFLAALEDDLAAQHPEVMALFEVEERPLGGGGRHPHLMWALEQLAWNQDYLSRSARILAKLARLDPSASRGPKHSLAGIFCCWHPNTAASLDLRSKALDSLFPREPEVAWELLLELLPTDHGVGHNGAEPRWRAKPERSALTWGAVFQGYDQIIAKTLKTAELRCERLCQLVDRTRTWRPEQRTGFVEQLRRFENTCIVAEERKALWSEIRDFVGRSRTYRFLEESDLEPFDELLELLASGNVLEKHSWLFNNDLPDLTRPQAVSTTDNIGIERRMEEVSQARQAAVVEIMREAGIDGILALAKQAQLPFEVGIAAAKTVPCGSAEDELLDRTLLNSDPKINQAGVCFVWHRREMKGSGWSEAALDSELFNNWPATKQAAFCLGLPDGYATWRIVAGLGEAAVSKYWGEVRIFLVRLAKKDECEFAVGKLLEVGRALEALDQAGSHPEKLSTKLLVLVLDAALLELAKLNRLHVGTLDHDIQRILTRLRESEELPQSELARLEWQYLPLLRPFQRPVTLCNALQSDPDLFADVVAHAFRADEEPETAPPVETDQSEEAACSRARLAWDLLSQWDGVPGAGQDGRLDADELKRWFSRARSACAARGRAQIGDIQIGRVLAHAAPDADGIWPPCPVRDLIEDAESRSLESGLHSGRINQRGVFTKSPSDGGRPERELAKRYRDSAKAVNAQYQRTARLLNALAETYESFGRHDDISAEKMGFI